MTLSMPVLRTMRFSWSLFLLCLFEALLWSHCTTTAAPSSSGSASVQDEKDQVEYLLRESKNLKSLESLSPEEKDVAKVASEPAPDVINNKQEVTRFPWNLFY